MSGIIQLSQALAALRKTTSTNEKLNILSELKPNVSAQDFFKMCLHPDFQFGCKQIPDYDNEEPNRTSVYDNVINSYNRLLKNKTDIANYMNYVKTNLRKDEYELFSYILKKDPSCGVSVALVNKTWPGLIDTGAKLCKAETFSKKAMENIKYPCYTQLKADGARCLCLCDKDGIKFISSSGKQYTNLNHLTNIIFNTYKLNDYNDGIVIDGELLVLDDNNHIMDRKTGNGILNKSIKGTINEKESNKIIFIAWDFIYYQEYYGLVNKHLPYDIRINMLENFILETRDAALQLISTKVANSFSDIVDDFKVKLQEGSEGIIVKNRNFIWQNKRVKDQVKFKLEMETSLKVIGWCYGAKGTKYENELGALLCATDDNKLTVSVGSGFSDEFRKEFAETYKNKNIDNIIIEVRSNGIINGEHSDSYSLFLPRMVEVRYDKEKADDFETVLKIQDAKMNLATL